MSAQCGFSGSEVIPDASTTQISIEVNGAVNNDLATSAQGVCRVSISFRHPHVGDLSVRLHSPSGQIVNLIGNIGNSANTSGSLWNVHFIPNGSAPMPDIGILPVWANTSNWQANTNYNGSYFPVAGNNLGMFNSGSVNGLWTIELVDGSNLDVGEIISFSIEFCEPGGINCSSCFKKAGTLPSREITACAGSIELNTGITPTFPFGNNGPNTGYKYIVSNNADKIIALLDVIDMRSFTADDYTVCGFAYDITQSELLPEADSTESFSEFKNTYLNGSPELCGDLTNECLTFHLLESTPLKEITQYICGQGPIIIEGQNITAPGVYNFNFTNRFGCDSNLMYTVLLINFDPVLSVSNVLSCNNNTAVIRTNSEDFPVGSVFSWFTVNGVLSSGIDVDSLIVTAPGTYFLGLEKDGCTDTISINVTSDISLPHITIITTHLSCAMPARAISVTSNPANVSIEWSGPNGFQSSLSNPLVTVPGIYTVRVTKQDGCSITGQINVTGDFEVPEFDFVHQEKKCADEISTIGIMTVSDITAYNWTVPDGSTINTSTVQTPLNCMLLLTVTSANGCKFSDSLEITFMFQNPILTARDTFIDCNNPAVNLPVFSDDINFTISWTGPSGFTSGDLSPVVDQAGTYIGIAVEPNGCQTEIEVEVTEDFTVPQLTITPASFACMQDSLRINTTPVPVNVLYQWQGPKLYASTIQDPMVYETGWYFVTITGANGCTRSDSVFVGLSSGHPDITVKDDSLTCVIDSVLLIVNIQSPANRSVRWTGPNGFTSNQSSPWVQEAGKYWVKVTNPANGCFTNKSVLVVDLTSAPEITLFQDSINCIRNEARFGFLNDPLINDFYWIVPSGDTIRDQMELFSSTVDTFDLVAFNVFGCRLDTFVHTAIDSSTPVIVVNDQFISCANPIVDLQFTSSVPVVNIEWTFPDGSLRTENNPSTALYGLYKLKISGANGCPDSSYFSVLADTTRPDVEVLGGTFTCKEQFFTLGYVTAITDGQIVWSGPDNFSSTEASPQVNVSGYYKITVTGANGCVGQDSALVGLSDVLPLIDLKDDSITCAHNPLILQPQSNAIDPQFNWTAPDGNQFNTPTISVNQPGLYTIIITDVFECVVYDTAYISLDTLKPVSILEDNYFLNCANDSLSLKGADSTDFYVFEWLANGQTIGTDSLQLIENAGNYELILTGKNGCQTNVPFIVTTDYVKPDLQAMGGELNCDFTKIDLTAISSTPSVQFEWNINGDIINNRIYTVDQVGLYPVRAIATNGCVSDTIVSVDTNYIVPDMVTRDGSLSCDSSNFLLNAVTNTIGSSFGWFGPDNFFSDQQHVYVSQVGTYYIFLKGANGCLNVDTVEVDNNPDYPTFQLSANTITCYLPAIPIEISSTDSLEKFLWTGPDGSTQEIKVISAEIGGQYLLTAYNENGCTTTDSIIVAEDLVLPEASFSTTDSIVCDHRQIELYGNIPPSGKNYNYQWATLDGSILTETTDTSVTIKSPGTYLLTTQDLHNGCAFTFSGIIEEKENPIKEILVEITNTSCKELSNGIIEITGVPNANGDVQYSIIDGYYGTFNYFNKLGVGSYTIGVLDSYGCKFEQEFEMLADDPIGVDLGQDTVIRLGDQVDIIADLNIDPSEISSVSWVNAPSSCSQCLTFKDDPRVTVTYKVTITKSDGCKDEDEKRVYVDAEEIIFVPNVFSPNGDGKNDRLSVNVSQAVSLIRSFRIFDRWGNNVFSNENFDPEDINGAWDGTMRGQKLDPGVFVYFVEYELITGEKLIHKGSVTLVR